METEKQYVTRGSHKVKLSPPDLYAVIFLNDDFTSMEFVVWALETYFDMNKADATELMLTVHNNKKAVVGKYVYDVAVTKTQKVINEARKQGYPLKVVVDKA